MASKITSFDDLCLEGLKDIYDSEHQITAALPKMMETATSAGRDYITSVQKPLPILLTSDEQIRLMREALAEALLGMREGEVPIGCVIACADPANPGQARIVARGHNRAIALQRQMAHAEIVAFENAGGDGNGKPPSLPLDTDDAILVSTLEPCVMCYGAAIEAGIRLVVFGLEAPADCGTKRVRPPQSAEASVPEISGGVLADESRALFVEWLQGKHGTKQAEFVEQLLALTK